MSSPLPSTIARASLQDGTYPRPQLLRRDWCDLDGPWSFGYDDGDVGRTEGWQHGSELPDRIIVPFPPESAASGIGDTGFHPVVWYRRVLTRADLDRAGLDAGSPRLWVRFGAVDHAAEVWLNGVHLGSHEGGSTPFAFDLTEALVEGDQVLVVRAQDDPHDIEQGRGKQDWQLEPHGIWYHRTTGIWQPVWLEAVPARHVRVLTWTPRVHEAAVDLDLALDSRPDRPVTAEIVLAQDGVELARQTVALAEERSTVRMTIPALAHGQHYDTLLWTPETPRLVDARIVLDDGSGHPDDVTSYLGLRTAAVGGGHFLLNDRPYYVRSVLNQGYWPDSHLAAPDADALRREVVLIKDLGFNATRVHQKVEDPRFLYWADRLGLLVWGEAPSAYRFSGTAVRRMLQEWGEVIARDASHPCIVTWVPLNESWGAQHIAVDERMRHYAQALWHLTKALDGTRPVVSNDGWEFPDSDIWSVHDYENDPVVLTERYGDPTAVAALVTGFGPAERWLRLTAEPDRGQPVMLTEFGGIAFAPGAPPDAWGYATAHSVGDFDARLSAVVGAVRGAALAGFCYTQLTDTRQEVNGLVTADRVPKLPIGEIRRIVTGARAVPGPMALRRWLASSRPVRGARYLRRRTRRGRATGT